MNDALRPTTLDDFHGQAQLVRDLRVVLGAARRRGEASDHLLFSGPPGLGKTTLAQIVATELNLPLVSTSAPGITKPGDLLAVLTALTGPSVVFIDEIHALERRAEELLYTAMEDRHVDMIVGEGPQARTIRIKLQPFTLVGATTQQGLVNGPLRDRFGFLGRLVPYTTDELTKIVTRSAAMLNVELGRGAAEIIASRSRGTPRIANRWLRRVRDWSEVHRRPKITAKVAERALDDFGIDALGLDPLGRDILQTIVAHFNGGPVGLTTLAAAIGEDERTIEGVYEPHLMREGLLQRTPRGRTVTARGWEHLGLTAPQNPGPTAQDELPL